MAIGPKLELRQGQSLVMTPQLQQAIKLLQMSNLELLSYVETELEQNPLLERGEHASPQNEATDEHPAEEKPLSDTDTAQELSDNSVSAEAIGQMDGGWENLYGESKPTQAPSGDHTSSFTASTASQVSGSGEGFDIDAAPAHSKSLQDHLREQFNIAISDPVQHLIATHLLTMLGEDGYLAGDLAALADVLGADSELIELTLSQLQTLDPPGVFARDLRECLIIQLRERDRLDPIMAKLLDNLDLLAKRDFDRLREICDCEPDDLPQMLEDIQSCNPRPGNAFGSEVMQPVVPDVFVREGADGGWLVELNSETLPRVLVNNQYHATVARAASGAEDQEFIAGCLATANWLVKSLDQRAQTILKVAREIVRQQDGFLVYGVQHLRPLKLKTVADAIEMHESTVSRVTANKFIVTPRGTLEMRYFFTTAIASAGDGEDVSAEAVRERIKSLIENESPKKVLSDDKIVDLLKAENIDIARRTVAKYREAMGFGSSVQRRREKKALA
ncbi:MAG: RNA polymerase factor sigma-54 [Hyphomicrobiales bacterium]